MTEEGLDISRDASSCQDRDLLNPFFPFAATEVSRYGTIVGRSWSIKQLLEIAVVRQ